MKQEDTRLCSFVLGLGGTSEEGDHHQVQRATWLSMVLEGNGSCTHRISGGAPQERLQREPWTDLERRVQTFASLDLRAAVRKQREPCCNPGKRWCKTCFWINIYSEDFHL